MLNIKIPIGFIGGPTQIDATTTVVAGVDSQASSGGVTKVYIDVNVLDSGGKIRWVSSFHGLSAGGAAVIRGRVFRVKEVSRRVGDADFVELINTDGAHFSPESLVVSGADGNNVYIGMCDVGVALEGVDTKMSGIHVARIQWQRLGGRNIGGCGAVKSTNHVLLTPGDQLNFGEFGQFRVEDVLPAKNADPDWVVLSPM